VADASVGVRTGARQGARHGTPSRRASRQSRGHGHDWARILPSEIGVPAPGFTAVTRRDVVERLATASTPVVLVEAPAGYGKTTAVGQWVTGDPRPTAWLTLGAAGDDATWLTAEIERALESVPPFGKALGAARRRAGGERLAQLTSIIRHAAAPFVLVTDDVDRVGPAGEAVLRSLARVVPEGSHLVLLTRGVHHLSLDALTGHRDVTRLGIDDLALTADEAAELFATAGLALDRADVEALVGTTRGWPAALALATSCLVDQPDGTGAADTFGSDPVLEEYIESEVLSRLGGEDRELLTTCAVLDHLSGAACDAVRATSGSAHALARLSRAAGQLVRKHPGSRSYELHPLVRDVLRRQLVRRDPATARAVLLRASEWSERQADVDTAVRRAHEARDRDRVLRLTDAGAPVRAATDAVRFSGWLELWSDAEIAADPALSVCAAWGAFARGDGASFNRWFTFARRGRETFEMPDGTPLRSALALLRAVSGRDGLGRMVADAGLATELGRRDDPALALARYARGSAYRLLGDAGRARAQLEAAAAQTSRFDPAVESHCLLQLAVLALDEGNAHEARTLVATARRRMPDGSASNAPALAGAVATLAYLESRDGVTSGAADMFDRAREAVARITLAMPWLAIDIRLLLARAAVELGDVADARLRAHEAGHQLAGFADAGELPSRLEALRSAIRSAHLPLGVAASGVTPAESRVLRYLPTHLTFPEIADALFVSRHTVKTQAVAVYRKLGVSSRSAAVAAARELGFLDD
jgi:LuxR family maltose regulon positive regulatory protein